MKQFFHDFSLMPRDRAVQAFPIVLVVRGVKLLGLKREYQ